MSKGESYSHVRSMMLDVGQFETTGIRRVDIKKCILDVPYNIYDVFKIRKVSFSASEWEEIKDYVRKGREEGKIIYFEQCNVFLDNDVLTIFYKETDSDKIGGKPYSYLEEKNNNSGVRILKSKTTACDIDDIYFNDLWESKVLREQKSKLE